jgi:hypothetical protein
MTTQADGWYDRTKPWNRPPKWSYSGPNQSNEERRTQEALMANIEPGVDLAEMVRPPIDVPVFRPRFGYRQRVIGIDDIIDIGRTYHAPANYSGSDAGYTGAARNAWGAGTW